MRHLNSALDLEVISFCDLSLGDDVELGIREGFYEKRTGWLDSGSDPGEEKRHFPPLFWLWIIAGMKITEAEGGGGQSDSLSTTQHFQGPLVPLPFSSAFFLL